MECSGESSVIITEKSMAPYKWYLTRNKVKIKDERVICIDDGPCVRVSCNLGVNKYQYKLGGRPFRTQLLIYYPFVLFEFLVRASLPFDQEAFNIWRVGG